jgi:hypothetical protein
MLRLFLFMHHIALCTISLLAHIYSYTLDRAEPESKFQAKQVRQVFRGSQASSCKDTNIAFRSRQAPVHHTIILDFYFELISLC